MKNPFISKTPRFVAIPAIVAEIPEIIEKERHKLMDEINASIAADSPFNSPEIPEIAADSCR